MNLPKELKKPSTIALIIIGVAAIAISAFTIFNNSAAVTTKIVMNIISESLMGVFFVILGVRNIKSKDKENKRIGYIFLICAVLIIFFVIKIITFIK